MFLAPLKGAKAWQSFSKISNGKNLNQITFNRNINSSKELPKTFTQNKVYQLFNSKNGISSQQIREFNVYSLFSFMGRKLKEKADLNPMDAKAQSDYMKHLSKYKQNDDIKARLESGAYAMDSTSQVLYLKALAKSGEIDKLNLPTFVQAYYPGATSSESSKTEGDKTASEDPNASNTTGATQGAGTVSHFPYQGLPQGPLMVRIHQTPSEKRSKAIWRFIWILLFIASLCTSVWLIRQLGGGKKGGASSLFGVSDAHSEVTNVVERFDDVMGCDEVKEELVEVVEYLKNPDKFSRLGARLPKGVLLVGEPGTGKTLLARAIAGEAGVPFLYCSGSAFDEIFVGVGSKRIRSLFDHAKKLGQCIIFIDEIDALGSARKNLKFNSSDNTLNQLLTELDGFKQTKGIIIIGATNFPESLDPALTRPGRFDKQIVVPVPDIKGRKDIIDLYLKKTIVAKNVDSTTIARGTPGFTGADLSNLINIAATKASVAGKDAVDLRDLEEAKDDVLMGIKRNSSKDNEKSRKMTAYHEGGHALVALYVEGSVPLHKATIIKRGRALGMTVQLPETDVESVSRKEMHAKLACMMGGRAAEEVVYGHSEVSSGASSDFKQATQLARSMVTLWGMSDEVGLISLDYEKTSGNQRAMIDGEVKKILQDAYELAKKLLTDRRKELDRVADALLELETLSAEEIKDVANGKKVQRPF
eukprot:TRINITY_DN5753_c0_g1_i1.p1 TRINITY_DN5753_c0_g1~~TRINITY_DN5753_c0_g1_i1.p1  ORF type:complete len:702 (-),score=233.24 TRINITY_DN5753_c0_g1_i1:62-2167(-)